MTYTDIWNEAYDILEEKGGKAMIAYGDDCRRIDNG